LPNTLARDAIALADFLEGQWLLIANAIAEAKDLRLLDVQGVEQAADRFGEFGGGRDFHRVLLNEGVLRAYCDEFVNRNVVEANRFG